jgi:hypothetical protein
MSLLSSHHHLVAPLSVTHTLTIDVINSPSPQSPLLISVSPVIVLSAQLPQYSVSLQVPVSSPIPVHSSILSHSVFPCHFSLSLPLARVVSVMCDPRQVLRSLIYSLAMPHKSTRSESLFWLSASTHISVCLCLLALSVSIPLYDAPPV